MEWNELIFSYHFLSFNYFKMSQWECPCCWSNNLEYGAVEFYDDQCYFPRTCYDCKVEWEEWYSMEFIEHTNLYDKDWNEILLDNQKENDS